MEYTVRPHDPPWPHRGGEPRSSHYRFRASFADTLRLLNDEVWILHGRQIVIQIDVRAGDIRKDGMLRSDARVGHPGVRVSFRAPTGTLVFGTDEYDHWQANLRAIALALQALRAVDRYGVTPQGQQYAGFKSLPPGVSANEVAPFPSSDAAAAHLEKLITSELPGITGAMLLESPAQLRRAWTVAAKQVHPDTPLGSTGAFQKAEAAKRMVEADHRQQGLT